MAQEPGEVRLLSRVATDATLTTDATLSTASGTQTPTSGTDDTLSAVDINHDEIEINALKARWEEAQATSLDVLRDKERKAIKKFQTPERLFEDLKRQTRQYEDHAITKCVTRIKPFLQLLKSVSLIFMTVMSPHAVEIAARALENIQILKETIDIIDNIYRELRLFTKLAEHGNLRSDIRHDVVDMFIILIKFWAEAARIFRPPISDSAIGRVQSKFKETRGSLEKSVSIVEKMADLSIKNMDDETQRRDADYLSTLNFNEDANTKFPCYEVPPKHDHFYGRSDEIETTKKFLCCEQASRELRVFVLHGLGGVGKSSAALAFVSMCMDEQLYDAIFYINAQTRADLRDSFTRISIRLELLGSTAASGDDKNIFILRNWLAKTDRTWLLIYDNVDDMKTIEEFLPPFGPIIITTRYRDEAFKAPGISKKFELQSFNKKEAVAAFNRIRQKHNPGASPSTEDEIGTFLINELGGLPLGVEQMAAYVEYRRLTIPKFLETYKKSTKRIHRHTEGLSSSRGLDAIWEMNFKSIQNIDASLILSIIAILNPKLIPIQLFLVDKAVHVKLPPIYQAIVEDEDLVEDAVDLLTRVSLVKRDGDYLSIHRLVQKSFIYSPSGFGQQKLHDIFTAAVVLVNAQFPKMGGPHSFFGRWHECAEVSPHVLSIVDYYESDPEVKKVFRANDDFVELLKNCAWYQYEIGEFDESLRLSELACEFCEDKFSPFFSQLYNNIGCVYYERNYLEKCREYWPKCLEIRAQTMAPDDIEISNICNNLGGMYMAEGLLDDAIKMYQRNLEIKTKRSNDPPEYLALGFLGLGRVYYLQKEFTKAMDYYSKAERLLRSSGKSGEWGVANVLLAIGNLHLAKNMVEKARENFHEAWELCHSNNPTHLFTGVLQYKLGVCEAQLGNAETALKYLDKAYLAAEHCKSRGDKARILWAKALILKGDMNNTKERQIQAAECKLQAEVLRANLVEEMKPSLSPTEQEGSFAAYDMFICGYFR
ncbi:hypothetical protein BGW36DRAFT_458327 [Talaromyces proteolyticus]|uniref:NB-ARC domain-containing protein n=1 Tax=Talaromyces proteolyticus TaxID=1131652 RepID=A0AAD4KZ57_9EURO|nr:uncharacterized protein BGW36DRAFT_458327 [Talaromyces proteolyticus]KAH8704216.1 hypothetical protein BGW36DRAFT_458327 [Talaromyces proteolyticus]